MVFLGHQRMLAPALINLIFSIAWFVTVLLLPVKFITVSSIFLTFLLLTFIKTGVFYFTLARQSLLSGTVGKFRESSKNLLKESWPYFALVLVLIPFTQFSNNFLDLNSNKVQIGYYNLSERLIGPVSFVMDFAIVALFPNLSSLWVKDPAKFKQYIAEGFKYFMLCGLVFCFLFTLFIPDAVSMLFPATYQPSIPVSQLQIWFLFLSMVDYLMGVILGATNADKVILKLGFVRSIAATPVLYFASRYGALGLASGYLISFAVFQLYLWYTFNRTTAIRIHQATALWIFAILLFASAHLIFKSLDFSTKIGVASIFLAGCGIYAACSYKISLINTDRSLPVTAA